MEPFIDVCILSHGNWTETQRALKSAWRLGLHVRLGITVEDECPFSSPLLSVYRVQWRDDFAAARNALLDQVSSRRSYFLWIDSDDEILCCPRDAPNDPAALIFEVRHAEYTGFTAGRRTTVHRNDPSIRWTGSIHERLALASGAPLPPRGYMSGLAVLHHGYEDDDVVMAKLRRNAEIAAEMLSGGSQYPGALVSVARLHAVQGCANAFEWLAVYRATEAYALKYSHPIDQCWESATALAYCGFTRPAERLATANPLNIPLQLSLLTCHQLRTGSIDDARFEFVLCCLQRALWDDRFPFSRQLVGATREVLTDHIERDVARIGWGVTTKSKCRNGNIEMRGNRKYIQSSDVLVEAFEEDTLLLSPVTNRVVSLNSTGKIFWDAFVHGASVTECVEMLQEASVEPLQSDALAVTRAFFQELLDAELIRDA